MIVPTKGPSKSFDKNPIRVASTSTIAESVLSVSHQKWVGRVWLFARDTWTQTY